uniref:Uncharacterized protein n=2 Tax=Arion vulgaris TaxID=1028688 RepID=A0A0B7A544_9EUPU
MRNLSVSESRRRHDDMEKHLKEAEAQLVSMSGLLEQREKMMKEAADEAEKKTTELEQKLLNQDGHLIEHGIDPVTGERITSDEVGERKVESNKKFTKKRVQEMRDKLKQMNNQTESYLSDIENTLQLLNNLELASDRLGRLSEGSLEQFNPALDEAHENILNENHHILTISSVSSITSLPLIDKKAQSENFDNYSVASEGNVDEHFYVPYIRHDDDEEDRDVDGGNITRNDVL